MIAERGDIEIDGGASASRGTELLMPATTITRCGHPPVPSAGGASSLHSAVTRADEAPTHLDEVERSIAHGRAGERAAANAAGTASKRLQGRYRCSNGGDHVVRHTVERVQAREAGGNGVAGVITDPGGNVARAAHDIADQRDAGAASPVVVRSGGGRVAHRAGHGKMQRDREPRRSSASVHGDSSGRSAREVHDERGEIDGPEEEHRVEVAVAEAQPEVEDVAVVVGRSSASARRRSRRHVRPLLHAHRDRLRGTSTTCAARRRA